MPLCKLLPYLGLWMLTACGGASNNPAPVQPSLPPQSSTPPDPGHATNLPVPDNRAVTRPAVLLFGNSHSGSNLAAWLQILLSAGNGREAQTLRANGAAYLDERLADGVSQQQLDSQSWSHLVLQAQKYSTTGLYNYSTAGAKSWIAQAKAKGITPVLYPEHPRAGNQQEGMRVFRLHQQIAAEQAACVAPVGPVWDAVIAQWPEIELHSEDGNHAAPAGVLLTSYILYEVISGNPADALPDLPALNITVHIQRLLRQAASAGVRQYPPCPF